MWAVLLLGMCGAGIWLHLKTGDAWNARFKAPAASPVTNGPAEPPTVTPDADREAFLAQIRVRREQAEKEAYLAEMRTRQAAAAQGNTEATEPHKGLRCINGVVFRRIPGGWENVPGETCP
ncbi:hypothetical protein ACQRWG_01690 [Stenotrophomonas maltophilia]